MEGFTIEGWDDFVENFSKFVDKWADKKKILLQRMANIYHGEVIPHVPVDTSRLVDSITIFDAKPRLNRLVESFLQQIGREIEGGSL